MKRVANGLIWAAIILSVAYTLVTSHSIVLARVVAVLVVVVAPVVGVIWFAVVVWPTRFRYERPAAHVVRIDRLGGQAEILTPAGWTPLTRSDI